MPWTQWRTELEWILFKLKTNWRIFLPTRIYWSFLKGTVSRDFFCLKDLICAIWTGKNGLANFFSNVFCFREDIRSQRAKIACPCIQRWLWWHGVSVVKDYGDTRFSRISSQKQKISRTHFSLFIWGPGWIF